MTKLLTLATLTLLFMSCGVRFKGLDNINVKTPETMNIQPDFERMATFCDERYGASTSEAEECFTDFRRYYKLDVSFDTGSIISFCEGTYTTPEEKAACKKEFSDFFSSIGGSE